VRVRIICFATVLALSALLTTLLPAQVSDEEKRKRSEFLKTRQIAQAESSSSQDETPTPTPKPKSKKAKPKASPSETPQKSPTPRPKAKKPSEEEEASPTPKAKSSASPRKASPAPDESESAAPKPKTKKKKASAEDEATPKPKSSASPREPSSASDESESATPKPKSAKKKSSAQKEVSSKKKKGAGKKGISKKAKESETEKPPKAVRAASPQPSETPVARPTAPLPRAVAVPTPAAPPAPVSSNAPGSALDEPAELTIEKTGYEKRPGFWARIFGGGGGGSSSGGGYRYLTRSVRDAIDRAPANRRNPPWQYIVVHNSGTRQGNAKVFDYYHKNVRHMRNGLAYHFVIGNGTSTGDGQIEIGDRWRRQINGGHVHSDHLNNIGRGICLVGDFNRSQPTKAQLGSCEELIRYLRQRCGKVGNHYAIVKPHREMNPPRWSTDCPGDAFPYSWFRRFQE
jgi:hypothetical protein